MENENLPDVPSAAVPAAENPALNVPNPDAPAAEEPEPALYVPEYDSAEIVEDGAPDFLAEVRQSFWD